MAVHAAAYLRVLSFATGLKLVRPELKITVVTGDGDGHRCQALRVHLENVEVKLRELDTKETTKPGDRDDGTRW